MSSPAVDLLNAVQPKPQVSILAPLYKWMEKVKGDKRSDGFHASEIYKVCPRQHSLMKENGLEDKLVMDADQWKIFNIGHTFHHMVQNQWLGPAQLIIGKWISPTGEEYKGYQPDSSWIYEEPIFRLEVEGLEGEGDKWTLTGACDGYLINDKNLEFKTCGTRIFPGLNLAYDVEMKAIETGNYDWYTRSGDDFYKQWAVSYARAHIHQVALYSSVFKQSGHPVFSKTTGGITLYMDKAKSRKNLKEFQVPILDGPLAASEMKVRAIHNREVKGGELPKGVCAVDTCERAQECPVAALCFKNSHPKDGYDGTI